MRNQTPKKRILLRGAALALALCMVLSLAACGKSKVSGNIRVDLSGRVNTLDPQFCSTVPERCLLKNCMEGLLRRLPDGTMAEGCAENYSVGADGLRYTFTLRENLQWSDGEPLTAPSLSPFPAPIPCCRKSWQSRRPSLAGRTSTPAPTPATAILSRI